MKVWAVATAALSLTALCACSSTEDEKAPATGANVEDQWKYHVKKNYPQWQAPAEAPATPTTTVPAASDVQQAAPAAVTTAAPAANMAPEAGNKDEFFAEPPGFIVKDNFGAYPSPVKADEPKGEAYSHYIVKKGDSLWTISKLIYHKADKWQKIYDVNKDVIKDPNRLKPGTDLKIPAP